MLVPLVCVGCFNLRLQDLALGISLLIGIGEHHYMHRLKGQVGRIFLCLSKALVRFSFVVWGTWIVVAAGPGSRTTLQGALLRLLDTSGESELFCQSYVSRKSFRWFMQARVMWE